LTPEGDLFFGHFAGRQGFLRTFLVSARKVPKEADTGEALSGWPAPAPEPPSPVYPTRPALTIPRSTLTYILSAAKMFRFLPHRDSASEIRYFCFRSIEPGDHVGFRTI